MTEREPMKGTNTKSHTVSGLVGLLKTVSLEAS